MIPRYCLPEMAAIWTEEAKLERWILVEVLATEAWAALGVVPPEAAAAIRLNSSASPEEVREREKITDHDVAAFVDVVQGRRLWGRLIQFDCPRDSPVPGQHRLDERHLLTLGRRFVGCRL